MELDDSFTEKLVQRTKARREYINAKKKYVTDISRKRSALCEEQQLSQDVPDEPTKESPKRQCLETSQDYPICDESEKENFMEDGDTGAAYVPIHAATKTRGLAALRKNTSSSSGTSDEELSHTKATSIPQVNKTNTYVFSTNSIDICSGRKSRFANLAADIRQWENNDHRLMPTNNLTSANLEKLPEMSHNMSHSSKSNSISIKLCYSSKLSDNLTNNSEQFLNSNLDSKFQKQNSSSFSPLKKDKNENQTGSPRKATRLEAWDQAIAATLGCQKNVKTSVTSSPLAANYSTVENNSEHVVEKNESEGEEAADGDNYENNDETAEDSDESYGESKNNRTSDYELNIKITTHNKDSLCNATMKPKFQPCELNEAQNFQNYGDTDPAELPLSARKALFEKALLSGSAKQNESPFNHKISVAERAAMFENATKVNHKPKSTLSSQGLKRPAPTKAIGSIVNRSSPVKKAEYAQDSVSKIAVCSSIKDSPGKKEPAASVESPLSPNKNIGTHTRLVQQRLIENASCSWQQKDIVAKATEERKQEISSLVNHWEKLSSSSNAENTNLELEKIKDSSKSQESSSQASDSYHETSESEGESQCDEDMKNEENVSDENESEPQSIFHSKDIIENETRSECQEQNYQDEEVGSNIEQHEEEPDIFLTLKDTGAKSEKSSASQSEKSSSGSDSYYDASRSLSCTSSNSIDSYEVASLSRNSDEISVSGSASSNPDVPLVYTVSIYRKQKQETRTPPLRTIVRREQVLSPPSEDDQTEMIQERIQALQEEVLRQQTIISQSSQALNLCSSTTEFSGSAEQVEGERLLLIATQKRQACLNEIQRLKTHGAQGYNVSDGTGTLIISDIQLPLKREFMAAKLEGRMNDVVHYFLCLIRYGAQVIVTQMMSTDDKVADGALCFTNHIKLQNLPADFSVIFEVYALQTKKEVLPHEKKYHIRRDHSKIRLTPKGKKADSKILLPAVSSPGGPNAVRSPSFGVIGYTRFNLQNCNKRTFTLDQVPFTSPIDSVLRVKLQLHAEHKVMGKGFLTMFEDISGFGAWHRRWCSLDGQYLSYWKYPEDEQKKEPIGTIDLKQCVTEEVRLISRDICARPHTFQLLTVRPQERGDKNTLITRTVNTLTTTKHLLSADTKEERIMWCNKLNEALTNVRKWDPHALRPVEAVK